VGQGKTADAELMLDNSLFGLPTGAAMVKYGTTNTFQAAPAILSQQGYVSASMHGDVATFWNRDNTYKSWGYNYFFYKSYFPNANVAANNIGYGMKDQIFMRDAANYIQKLPQPFYAKIITVTNHYPYEVDQQMQDQFPATQTGDKTVDHYVQTAHYLDTAFGQFIDWLKASGLYDNSLLYVYGDHYGISNNHKAAIAKLLGKTDVTGYDLAQFQKVPLMIHAANMTGGINHTYGGEIDVLPTLLDLLGVPNNDSIQFGHDLLSTQRPAIVSFRDGDWITPTLIKFNNEYFKTDTGELVDSKTADQQTKDFIKTTQKYVDDQLSNSDKVVTGDLLRFYNRDTFTPVNRSLYNYAYDNGISQLNQAQVNQPSSIEAKNGGNSLLDSYAQTDQTLGAVSSKAEQSTSSK
jgi:lipoteichoic acid synthase